MLKKFWGFLRPNPFDALLKKASKENKSRFLIAWNRGLGDIPLGLFALIYRIRSWIPHASIFFLTRSDLAPAFEMLQNIYVLISKEWKRGQPIDISQALEKHQLSIDFFDLVWEKLDPTNWFKWQKGKLVPKLNWNPKWDALSDHYHLKENQIYIGVHVDTETGMHYGYEKNWPLIHWQQLFKKIEEETKANILLFGLKPSSPFLMKSVIDLRGKTTFFEMLSIIKNKCLCVVAPDSGVLSIVYYLYAYFPLRLISLWADPKQGILRQNVSSPNKYLNHIPLIAKEKQMDTISVDRVFKGLFDDREKKTPSYHC